MGVCASKWSIGVLGEPPYRVHFDDQFMKLLTFYYWKDATLGTNFSSVDVCNALRTNNVLLLRVFCEMDNGRHITHVVNLRLKSIDYRIIYIDYLLLYGSLQAIEIACWYMNSDDVNFSMQAQSCVGARLDADECVMLLRKTSFGKFDTRFRSYPQERERNPLDVYCIWQHLAWNTYNLLTRCHLPSTIVDIIMSYAMQPLAPPYTHHGFTNPSCLFFFFSHNKKKSHVFFFFFFCLSGSIQAKLALLDWRRKHDHPFNVRFNFLTPIVSCYSNEIIFTHALYSGDTNMIHAFLKTSILYDCIWDRNRQRFWDMLFGGQHSKNTNTANVICCTTFIPLIANNFQLFKKRGYLQQTSYVFLSQLYEYAAENHIQI